MADAAGEPSDADCCKAFQKCVEMQEGKTLPVAEKKQGKSMAVKKALACMKEEKMQNSCDASILPKYQDKKTKKISDEDFVKKVIPDLAKMKLEAKAPKGKKPSPEQIEAECKCLKKKLCDGTAESKDTSKGASSKACAVTDRMTDTSKYTGSHKERFDGTGKGKGASGRTDEVDTSGYVGNYKGAGTFEKK